MPTTGADSATVPAAESFDAILTQPPNSAKKTQWIESAITRPVREGERSVVLSLRLLHHRNGLTAGYARAVVHAIVDNSELFEQWLLRLSKTQKWAAPPMEATAREVENLEKLL